MRPRKTSPSMCASGRGKLGGLQGGTTPRPTPMARCEECQLCRPWESPDEAYSGNGIIFWLHKDPAFGTAIRLRRVRRMKLSSRNEIREGCLGLSESLALDSLASPPPRSWPAVVEPLRCTKTSQSSFRV